MKNISEQKVVVLCDFTERMNGTVLHGIFVASFLQKELCLLSLFDNRKKKLEIQEKLSQLADVVKKEVGQMVVSTLVLKGVLEQNAERLAGKYDAVIVIMNQMNLSDKLKALQESTIPFLFVEGKNTDMITYKKVVLPVDYRKEMKETSLWASYLGRFNKAEIEVLGAHEKNRENQSRIKKNLIFIHKFLKGLNIQHFIAEGEKDSWAIQFEGLKNAYSSHGDVLIILGSKHITMLDLLIGLPEKKIIKKAGTLPVLCINPTKDLNILCD